MFIIPNISQVTAYKKNTKYISWATMVLFYILHKN